MRWWSVADFVSNAGTRTRLTVQNLLVLQITGSAAATGLSTSVQAAPALFMSPPGGAAVDRRPRRLTAGVSQALLGAVAFATAVLVALVLVLVALDRLDMTSLTVPAAATGVIATARRTGAPRRVPSSPGSRRTSRGPCSSRTPSGSRHPTSTPRRPRPAYDRRRRVIGGAV